MDVTLTETDIKIIRATLDRLRNPECGDGCYDPDCCQHCEIVVLSFGYAEVFDNGEGEGECVAFGGVVWTED